MKLEAQRLRLARVLLVAVLALLSTPAAAQAGGPEPAPVNGPSRLGPEPAPGATPAPPPSVASARTSVSTSHVTATTSSRPVVARTTPTQARPTTSAKPEAHQPPPKPKATHAVKAAVRTIAHGFQKPAARIALGAVPTTTSDSNRLLFLGGLALLVLVLGDATFLAISARAIREDR